MTIFMLTARRKDRNKLQTDYTEKKIPYFLRAETKKVLNHVIRKCSNDFHQIFIEIGLGSSEIRYTTRFHAMCS